jgi:Tim10/DDP family zinc finger
MGWFSGSSDDAPPSTQSFDDTAGFSGGDAGHAPMGGGGGGMTQSDMQQFAANLQQQALVQAIITDITTEAVKKCLTGSPKDNKLNGTQVACIHSTVNKWMDTNEYMNGRMQAKTQQAQQGAMQMH